VSRNTSINSYTVPLPFPFPSQPHRGGVSYFGGPGRWLCVALSYCVSAAALQPIFLHVQPLSSASIQ